MDFSTELKKMRQRLLLSQVNFAKELGVSYSTVNRWENERVKPSFSAMKRIKEFCLAHSVDFSILENTWLEE